jgi:hypothetical protein
MVDRIEKVAVKMDRDFATIEMLEAKLKFLKKNVSETYTLIKTTERFEERYEQQHEKIVQQLMKDQDAFNVHTNDIRQIHEKMKIKCDNYDFNMLKESCERFALYDDLRELYNKCLPPLAVVQAQMEHFKKEHE